jgi:hypothetical protein
MVVLPLAVLFVVCPSLFQMLPFHPKMATLLSVGVPPLKSAFRYAIVMLVLAGKLPLVTVMFAIYPALLFWFVLMGTSVALAVPAVLWLI